MAVRMEAAGRVVLGMRRARARRRRSVWVVALGGWTLVSFGRECFFFLGVLSLFLLFIAFLRGVDFLHLCVRRGGRVYTVIIPEWISDD